MPYVETKEYEYLYSAGDEHVFMDTETYDQLSFNADIIGTAMDYLLPNSVEDSLQAQIPKVEYAPANFLPSGKVAFDIVREPKASQCYY